MIRGNSVVFDRKRGLLGVKRLATDKEQKEHGVNYMVEILDPITLRNRFKEGIMETVKAFGDNEYDWQELPKNDPRVQFWKLFEIIEGGEADWYYSGYSEGDSIKVEEAYIENPHEVFEKIRELFK